MPVELQDVVWLLLSIALGAAVVALWAFWRELRAAIARNEQWKWATAFVLTAEQMFIEDGDGPKRLDWVLTQIKAYFPKLDTTLARVMVERIVSGMNAGMIK